MGTSKHSNHSTTGSATPTRYHNHSTVVLGYQHAEEHAVCQQFLSKVVFRAACRLFMRTRVSSLLTCRGHSLDLLAGLMTEI